MNLSPTSYGTCPSLRKYFAPTLDFIFKKFGNSLTCKSCCSLVILYPRSAIRIAGLTIFGHSKVPYLSCRNPITARVLGTVVALYPTSLVLFFAYLAEWAREGERLEPSIAIDFPLMCKITIDCPPIPDAWGSHTPRAKAVAQAASTAFPPFSRIFTPAFVASGNADATIPFFASENFLSLEGRNLPSIFCKSNLMFYLLTAMWAFVFLLFLFT